MIKFFKLLKGLFHTLFRVSGSFYVLTILIIIVIIGGGRYFWRERGIENPPKAQIVHSEPTQAEGKEAEDEEDPEEEEPTTHKDSPWTLLKTALPARYYEPAIRSQAPSVAIVLTGLGLNKNWTDHVLATLNKKITLVFSPYSENINSQLQKARSLGYEVLVALPMEPYTYPNPDPGPLTLLTGVKVQKNIEITRSILNNAPPGIGLIGEQGSRFVFSQSDLEPVLKEIKDHGSIFIDPNTSLNSQVLGTCKVLNMTCHQIDLTLPLSINFKNADEFLKKIIQSAQENGTIIISVPAIPAFTDILLKWIATLAENGITLVGMPSFKTPDGLKDHKGPPGDDQGISNANR